MKKAWIMIALVILVMANAQKKETEGKEIIIYDNHARLPDSTIDTALTLDYFEQWPADSYAYLLSSGGVTFDQEYDEATDSWPILEGLLQEAQSRNIEIWVTFYNPIYFENGNRGAAGQSMLFKEWFTSLAKLSTTYSNLKGVIVDDFGERQYWADSTTWQDENGNHLYTPQYLSDIQTGIDSENPSFQFYVVLYYPNMIHSYWDTRAPYIDGLILPDWGPGVRGEVIPFWTDTAIMDSQISTIKQDFILSGQKLLLTPYVTKHSFWADGANDEEYIEKVIRKGIEDTDGLYVFTMPRDLNIGTEGYCDNLPTDADQSVKNGCVLKEVLEGPAPETSQPAGEFDFTFIGIILGATIMLIFVIKE